MICAPALNHKIGNAAHSGVSEVLFFTKSYKWKKQRWKKWTIGRLLLETMRFWRCPTVCQLANWRIRSQQKLYFLHVAWLCPDYSTLFPCSNSFAESFVTCLRNKAHVFHILLYFYMTTMLLLASLETTFLLASQAIQMGRWNVWFWDIYCFQRATRVKAKLAVVRQTISAFIDRLAFKCWEACSFEHGLVVGNVARSQNSLFYHFTRPPGERLVVFLGVDFWHNSDYSMVWVIKVGSPACGE